MKSLLIVNASRFPPKPLAGQRLEAAGQQLEAWKAPLESSWRRLGSSKTSSGELLEASWRLPELSWRLLERLGGALGAPGADLEASWEVLGRSWRRLRGVLEAPWAVLEPSWELWRPCWSHLEAKKLPKWSPGGSRIGARRRLEPQTRIPQKLLFFQRILMIFKVLGHHFGVQNCSKWVPNRIIDAEGVRKPLDWLLERSWKPSGPKKSSSEASWSRLGALKIA